ncbi:TPA: glycosyltransferase family 2 protein [Streptococcus agalactiae]|nr:glycosyltransferase family 2 protein [Streptococcus agalactiae]
MKEKVTVIIPIYNSEAYLKECVQSVLQQTHPLIEVILIDDGSTDNSGEICDNLSQEDNRILVFHKKNGGVSSARNLGLDKSTGEFITFVDSDDFVAPNMIEIMLKNLITENADIAEVDFDISNERDYRKKKRRNIYKVFKNNNSLKEFLSGNRVENIVCTKLYKKSIIGNLRFDENLKIGEDLLFNCKLLCQEHRIVVDTTSSLYTYRIVKTSVMNQKFNENSLDFITIFNEISSLVPARLANYVEAKFLREKIKCLRKMFELGSNIDNKIKVQREIFFKDIKSYPFYKAVKYLSLKGLLSFYLMKCSPKLYVMAYRRFQKQ